MIMIIIIMIRLMLTVIIKTLRKRMSKSDRTHPEFRDIGMYHVINDMKKVSRGFITLPEHSSPFACSTLSIHHLDC